MKGKNNPIVSVIMPVYNGEKFLAEAIESILEQTFSNFEFIILNDGSSDLSEKIILSYLEKDKRIKYFPSTKNKGLIFQLNKGIKNAKGKYVARMDADDISFPDRFEKQVGFLKSNPKIALLGGQCIRINTEGKKIGISNLPCSEDEINAWNIFLCPFVHPSIFVRLDIIQEYKYDEQVAVEDYYLWSRILEKHKGRNLEEPILFYREHLDNTSTKKNEWYHNTIHFIYRKNLENIQFSFTSKELDVLSKISGYYTKEINSKELNDLKILLDRIFKHCIQENIFAKKTIQSVIGEVWFEVCYKNIFLYGKGLSVFYSYLKILIHIPAKKHLKFLIRRIERIFKNHPSKTPK